MAGISHISPESRQKTYLTASQAGVQGDKFITETAGDLADPEVPSDVVNRTPPSDGHIASAGNPIAFKLDGARDEFGNEWNANSVQNASAVPFDVQFDGPVKVRRVTVYVTKPDWDDHQRLSRAQFDLSDPL